MTEADHPTTRVVLVSGTAQGIGRACAEAFLETGAIVVGCDLHPVADGALGPRYQHHVFDVGVAADVQRWVDDAVQVNGRVDVLVNNAGVHPVSRPIDDVSVADFESLVRLNLVSVFAACKAALPHLRRTRGSVVNIASLVGQLGQELAVEYVATKAAIAGLTRALAIDEARHGVRVNSVSPGAIRTPLAESLNSEAQLQTIAGWAWFERLGTPAEVADVVVYLGSERAGFVTGQDVVVSGGAELGYGLKASAYYRAMGVTPGA
jgi:NAD(P)-dependent dehydrogenase (short-subunit alcohol dehydrogenase family)